MKRIILFPAAACFLLTVFMLDACQSAKNSTASKMLKFDLEKGKGYDYEMIINMDQELMGQPVQMDMTTYYSMDITEDDGSIKTISSKLERFKMKTAMMGFNIDVDTDEPVNRDTLDVNKNPLQIIKKIFAALKGTKFSMKVNREGKITDISGLENLGDKLATELGLDEGDKTTASGSLDKAFNKEEIARNFERFWYIFPNKEVKVGDSWKKTSSFGGQMPATYESTYKVTDIEGDMVTLEEKSLISAKQTINDNSFESSGEISGIVTVDSRSGLLVNSDQDLNMKINSGGMEVKIKGKSKIKGKARQ
ncbi:MAG: hypothetical protein IPG86_02265 [Chitinophagaceae bacterium]|jgi:Family of unknown function (DUF6263)|nr:hypothetical protein [Chitinophagaceae bacterium]